jgi:L-seryl-tRNA(Ser) seleniumtransferase
MYDRIPSVDALVNTPLLAQWSQRVPRPVVVSAAREVLGELRDAIARGAFNGHSFELDDLARDVTARLEIERLPPLTSAINATGIILHTGLGRAPLAEEAVAAMTDVAAHYAPVELDLETGERGHRADVVRKLLCELTGAESATVVNNNAAATMLVLAALARDKSVIVSRGELIEIGGSFRLPDVMRESGAILREVGTTNRTHLRDYAGAIDDTAGALMKVHTSNYRVEGFTAEVAVEQLVELGRRHELPVIHDTGSGLLRKTDHALLADEPDAASSIAAGADAVLFSGDKLLGGPQCGIIVGRQAWIERIEHHPLARAFRVDKLTLAALGATLQLHRDPQRARSRLPIYRMLDATTDDLVLRARAIAGKLGVANLTVEETDSYFGGGSIPTKRLPSIAIKLSGVAEAAVAHRLRCGTQPVVARVQQGAVWLDLRTVFPSQDQQLANALRATIAGGDE